MVVKFHGKHVYVTFDGRQALEEGPRKIGHCIYCKGQCAGCSAYCEARVFRESDKRPRST